jgi:serine O-acetyltransferase
MKDNKFIIDNYSAFNKIVISDYPFDVAEYFLDQQIKCLFYEVLSRIIEHNNKINNRWYSKNKQGIFDLAYLDHYLNLCYRFSNEIYRNNLPEELAKAIYYSSRVRCSCDIFYKTEIGEYFHPVHPLGTILTPQSIYGKGLVLYEHVHIAPYFVSDKDPENFDRPEIGEGVIIYGYSKIMGKSKIGDNVSIAMGTTIINEDIPSNSKVMMENNGRLIILPNDNNNLVNSGAIN